MACTASRASDPLNNSGVGTAARSESAADASVKLNAISNMFRTYVGDKDGNLQVQDFLKVWREVDPVGYDENIVPALRRTLNSSGTIEMDKFFEWVWGDWTGADEIIPFSCTVSMTSPQETTSAQRVESKASERNSSKSTQRGGSKLLSRGRSSWDELVGRTSSKNFATIFDLKGQQNWATVFRELDKDGDGWVTQEEMYDAILGWMKMAPEPESECFRTLRKCFPSAVPCPFVSTRMAESLERAGIVPSNTICATSICPDEINFSPSGMAHLLSDHWGASYSMGGLAGVPFTGRSGYRAVLRHMPEDGNVIIFFGPHISINQDGELTKLTRRGQFTEGRSCGALCHAFDSNRREGAVVANNDDFSDIQMHWLRQKLTKMAATSEDAMREGNELYEQSGKDVQSALVYEVYELIQDMLLDITTKLETPCIKEAADGLQLPNLVLIGGIQINLPQPFDDHFEPLMYKLVRKDGTEKVLLEEVCPPLTPEPASDMGVYNLLSWLHWSPAPGTPCFKALHQHFPGVMPSEMVVRLSCNSLRNRDFTDDNTLFGQSCCPDEINTEKGGMLARMVEEWGECFPLGGIGGVPFTGKTGFGAFSGHVPEGGNVLICFGPHIAVSENGELGKVLRLGQSAHSAACGAVLAAYKSCQQPDFASIGQSEEFDMQQSWLRRKIGGKMHLIEASPVPLAALIRETYEAIKENMLQIVNHKFGSGKLVLLGGIQINMPESFKDHFQPLMFTCYHSDGTVEDLLPETSLGRPLALLDKWNKTPKGAVDIRRSEK